MSTENIKDEARRLLDRLPDNLTWDELMHELRMHNETMEKQKATSEGERTRRPPRMQLSREEVLKRMKDFPKRREPFLAAARAAKN